MSKPYWYTKGRIPVDFYLEVTKGNIAGHSIIHKFGHTTVGTSMVPITHTMVYQTPITAIALEILSDDANDTAAGSGARTIYIEGLALDGTVVTQTVALDGLTPVSIPVPLWRLYRWYVATSGVYATPLIGSHEGNLTIRAVSDASLWSVIDIVPFPHGQSEIGWYTVPLGYRAFIVNMDVTVDGSKSADIMVLVRRGADIVAAPFDTIRMVAQVVGVQGHSAISESFSPHNNIGAFSDIGFLGKVTSNTADIAAHMEILLIADGY